MNFKQRLATLIDFPVKDEREIENLLMEIEDPKMGDFALPCFKFAKELRKSPVVIANEFAKSVKKDEIVE
ncbi:MAG TPA: arginine--tRNA ligase, partial [Eubacteriales bacterium]|nr:arginine--tRNA ligase [Eubacteriales bacterium]